MALVLENFQTMIQGKFFVSIEAEQDVLDFTNLNESGTALRNAATAAKVIVFLPSINKLFARGSYYGIDNEDLSALQTTLTTLDGTVSTLGTALGQLTTLVHTQGNTIDSHTTTLASHTSSISDMLDDISDLQTSVAALSPGGTDLSTLVADAVEDALENQLETALGESSTIAGINQSITALNNSLLTKAEQAAFNALVQKLGISSWTWIEPTLENPEPQNITVVDQLNRVVQNISQIPHFGIEVVDQLPTGNDISKTTIYLVRSANYADPSNNEIFTEYVYIDKNYGKTGNNPDTGEPWQEDWVWETLGRQFFNVSNYLELSNEDFERIKNSLEVSITAIQTQLGNADITQIATNKTNIEALQTSVGDLSTNLAYILDSNGNFLLTGSDIKTSNAVGSNTIATDIAALQNNKLDKDSVQWVIISNS